MEIIKTMKIIPIDHPVTKKEIIEISELITNNTLLFLPGDSPFKPIKVIDAIFKNDNGDFMIDDKK